MPDSPHRVRTAIFVDFDNIYLALRDQDPKAAEAFATGVDRWDAWIRGTMPFVGGGPVHRDILLRRCYLNPRSFHAYRPFFTTSAYQVQDCPPLTAGGKTSTDISMVMDILDALAHPTHFDEFVLLSGDADFTPVLVRLRAHDRRTAVLAVGQASVAYKKACDCLIDLEDFLTEGIGCPLPPAGAAPFDDAFLIRVADALLARALRFGRVERVDLLKVFKKFPEFAHSNWFGEYSQEALLRRLCRLRPELVETESGVALATPRSGPAPGQSSRGEAEGTSHRLDGAHGLSPVTGMASPPAPERLISAGPDVELIARRVHQLTGAPRLTSAEYALLFGVTFDEVRRASYSRTGTSKAVRDTCVARGMPIARSDVGHVLQGLYYAGAFKTPEALKGPEELAEWFARNVEYRCNEAEAPLAEDERPLLRQWIVGGFTSLAGGPLTPTLAGAPGPPEEPPPPDFDAP